MEAEAWFFCVHYRYRPDVILREINQMIFIWYECLAAGLDIQAEHHRRHLGFLRKHFRKVRRHMGSRPDWCVPQDFALMAER